MTPPADSCFASCERRNVDVERCRVDPERATGLSVVLSNGDDRAILTSLGAMASLTADEVTDEMLAATKHLHVSSPHLPTGASPPAR